MMVFACTAVLNGRISSREGISGINVTYKRPVRSGFSKHSRIYTIVVISLMLIAVSGNQVATYGVHIAYVLNPSLIAN